MNAELIPLSDAAGSIHRCGAKAANLGTALVAGHRVPPGVVLTAGDMTPDIVARLTTEVGRLGTVAVRSSGEAEDGGSTSFAGQYETVLGVQGIDAVLDAVRVCRKSANATRVSVYRSATGDPTTSDSGAAIAPLALLIQRMAPAEVAGVAFGQDPVTGADRVIIEAVPGLGDALVGGSATPERWSIDGMLSHPTMTAADAGAPAAGDGSGLLLDPTRAMEVARLTRSLGLLFGSPQDVEWAFANDELWLLQSRPITTHVSADAAPLAGITDEAIPPGFWSLELTHFPQPLTPFTASLLHLNGDALREGFGEHGMFIDGLDMRTIRGWAYQRIVPLGGVDRPPAPPVLQWLGMRLLPEFRERRAVARTAIRERLDQRILQDWSQTMRPRLIAEAESLAEVDADRLDDGTLRAHWERTRELHAYGVRCHFRLHVPIGIARFTLAQICRELFGWDEARTFELMSGLSTASTDAAAALAELGARIDSPALRELVDRADGAAVAGMRAADPAFAEAFDAYQRQYATRVLRYDFAELSMRERPELTLATLRDQLRLGFDPAARAASARQERERTLADAQRQLRGAEDRARFEAALTLATLAHPIHEENEFYAVSRPAALVREATLAVGRRAVVARVIRDADDVFFLTADEVAGLLTGPDRGDLVIRRRAEHERARRSTPAAAYGVEQPPPPLEIIPEPNRWQLTAVAWAVAQIFAENNAGGVVGDDVLTGIPASPGRYIGTARVIMDESQFDRIQAGDVLVCPVTSPVWSILFSRIGALVTDVGGTLSHPAIIAREFGIPAVVATRNGTAFVRDGDHLEVDGVSGAVRILSRSPESVKATATADHLERQSEPVSSSVTSGGVSDDQA